MMSDLLRRQGEAVNEKRIRRLMRLMGLMAIYPIPFRVGGKDISP